jgi:hypothetical protein
MSWRAVIKEVTKMSDLSGARAKIEWAKKHIRNLSVKKTALLRNNSYGATPEYYSDRDATVFYLDKFTAIDPDIPMITGDAVHNLRSALDLLAWALYARRTKGKGTHIYFPIFETPKKYKSGSERKVEGISEADIEAITLLKPYKGGNDHLWGLHELDITDKHRLLITPVIAVGRVGIHVSAEFVEREMRGLIRFNDKEVIERRTVVGSQRTKPKPSCDQKGGRSNDRRRESRAGPGY